MGSVSCQAVGAHGGRWLSSGCLVARAGWCSCGWCSPGQKEYFTLDRICLGTTPDLRTVTCGPQALPFSDCLCSHADPTPTSCFSLYIGPHFATSPGPPPALHRGEQLLASGAFLEAARQSHTLWVAGALYPSLRPSTVLTQDSRGSRTPAHCARASRGRCCDRLRALGSWVGGPSSQNGILPCSMVL